MMPIRVSVVNRCHHILSSYYTHLFDARRCAIYQHPPAGHTPPTAPSRLSHGLKRSPKPSSPTATVAISSSSGSLSIRHSILLLAQPSAEPTAPETIWKTVGFWHKKPRILIGSTACWPRHRPACCWIRGAGFTSITEFDL